MAIETREMAAAGAEQRIAELQAELVGLDQAERSALNAGDSEAWERIQQRRQLIPVEIHGLRIRALEDRIATERAHIADMEAERRPLLSELETAEREERDAKARCDGLRERLMRLDPFPEMQIIRGMERELEERKAASMKVRTR